GNFGTRELAWAAFFDDYGHPRDALIAYAFAVNAVFLVLNLLLGLAFLPRALELVAAVRSARRSGAPLAGPAIHDPTDQGGAGARRPAGALSCAPRGRTLVRPARPRSCAPARQARSSRATPNGRRRLG